MYSKGLYNETMSETFAMCKSYMSVFIEFMETFQPNSKTLSSNCTLNAINTTLECNRTELDPKVEIRIGGLKILS